MRGGSLGGPGREQDPHQPVDSRRKPGFPQRGHIDFAAASSVRLRHGRHTISSRKRIGAPHPRHRREHSAHRPVSDSNTRSRPQSGHCDLAACSRRRRVHRQHNSRPMMPTGALQSTQSRCRFPMILNRSEFSGLHRWHRTATRVNCLALRCDRLRRFGGLLDRSRVDLEQIVWGALQCRA